MGDWLTPEQRRRNMTAIRSTGTEPETRLAVTLRLALPGRRISRGYQLPGKPDYYLPALRLAVFADGCYWHCCSVHGRIPEDNRQYWTEKFARNRRRDRRVTRELRSSGHSVLRIWEHDLRHPDSRLIARIRRAGSRASRRRRDLQRAVAQRPPLNAGG